MERFGGYRIETEIGSGLGTRVYQAVEEASGRRLALKLFQLELVQGSVEEEAWLERFRRETKAASRIIHPSVVRLFSAGVLDQTPYVDLELVDGETLARALLGPPMELGRRVEIAAGIAEAIAVAHEQGVLHLSLRPSNVFIDRRGMIKVSDFGELDLLAAESGTPSSDSIPPQLHYRAPEQVYGRRADARTDVFTLGILLYELTYRRRPFEGDSWFQVTHRILNQSPPRLRDSSGEAPLALLAILERALAKDPSERYRSAREMERALLATAHLLRNSSTGDVELSNPAHMSVGAQIEPPAAPLVQPGEAALVIQDGEEPRTVSLDNERITLGRKSDNDVIFLDDSVSRYHAILEKTADGWAISDRRSRHGTLVNDRRLASRLVLRDGDRIELGHARRARMTFRSGAAPGSPAPVDRAAAAAVEVPVSFLLDAAHALNSSLALDEVLNVILDCALGFTQAERGFLLLRDAEKQLVVRLGRQQGARQISPGAESVSMSVVRKCLESESPILLRDALEEYDIGQQRSIMDLKLRSILCLPLLAKGKMLGVLYLDSRHARPAFNQDQHGSLLAFAEYAAAAIENARLYEMAIRDQRTGLYRHDYFEDRLNDAVAIATRDGLPVALIFADIDHFKQVNDRHGHNAGNVVLREVAELLRLAARSSDVAARWGGEEFVMLAPATGLEQALSTAERLRREASALVVQIAPGVTLGVTVSFGVAVFPAEGITSASDLVEAADRALYAAKQGGRNKVVAAPVT